MARKHPDAMNFWEHLEALRWHIIRSIGAVVLAAIIAFLAKSFIFDSILFSPREPSFITNRLFAYLASHFNIPSLYINKEALSLQSIQLAGQFGVHVTVSLVAGIIIAFPYIFYEIWGFINPALKQNERKYASIAIVTVSLLFFLGVLFGYYIVSPLAINFLGNYNVSSEDIVKNTINLESYISTITSIVLSSGVVFELPVFVYFLVKIGFIDAVFLRKYRRHSIILIMIVSAILTPPDPFSLILVSLPLLLLYEISIFIAVFIKRKQTY